LQITLLRTLTERHRLVEALHDFCREQAISSEVHFAADLALEEHVTNILTYSGATQIVIRCAAVDGLLVIEVEDDGKAFNPLTAPCPNIAAPLEEKPVGGLGIHLMREFMDELFYSHEGSTNVLRMKKRLTSEAL
jgi:anti-sigma regulatory factor (Ser/Thr protein kinase)